MSDFREDLNEQLKDKKFKKEYDILETRYEIIKQLIRLRKEHSLTQKQLAEKVNTTQPVISRIENGNMNIGIDLLNRIARKFGKKIL